MTKFTEFVGIKPVGDHRYILTDDLTFEIGRIGSGYQYTAPAGFVFDVSIPWFLRWAFSRDDIRYLKASAIHDHMWKNGWDLQTAAAVFYRALRASYVPTWRSVAMYLGVSAYSLTAVDQTTKGANK